MIPTPTQQEKSTVIHLPLEKAWSLFRKLLLNKLAPKIIKEVKWNGTPSKTVGAIFEVTYADGAKWELQIQEISDYKHSLIYQVVKTTPETKMSSIVNIVKFRSVSMTGETFVKWTTLFSNDVDANAIHDNKYKKQDFFKAVEAFVAAPKSK